MPGSGRPTSILTSSRAATRSSNSYPGPAVDRVVAEFDFRAAIAFFEILSFLPFMPPPDGQLPRCRVAANPTGQTRSNREQKSSEMCLTLAGYLGALPMGRYQA